MQNAEDQPQTIHNSEAVHPMRPKNGLTDNPR